MPAPSADTPTRELPVEGMQCGGCASSVEKLVSGIPSVDRAEANFGTHRVRFHGEASLESVHAALKRGGYGLGLRHTLLRDAVTEAEVRAIDGVVSVTPSGNGLVVEHVDDALVLAALRGFALVETEEDPERARVEHAGATASSGPFRRRSIC